MSDIKLNGRLRERLLYVETLRICIDDNENETYLLGRQLERVVDREEGIAVQERIRALGKVKELHVKKLVLEELNYRVTRNELVVDFDRSKEVLAINIAYGKEAGFVDA